MPPLQLLIKPASGACDMRCRYCFYADEMARREQPNRGMMRDDTLETLVQKALEYADGRCSFVFQGGEPTLAGIAFYQKLHELAERHNAKGVSVEYAIQTNGYALDEEWAALFQKHRYLVGLSLDGPKNVHDRYRKDHKGEGTHERALQAAALLKRYGVDFNVLCVVTAHTAKNAASVYAFYKKHGLDFQQYIPCLDPLGEVASREDYSLTSALYANFLKKLFDLWYEDNMNGRRVYNRAFENYIGMLRSIAPEGCDMTGECGMQHVIEADGSVYPCDFYALDGYRIGDIHTDSFDAMRQNRLDLGFIEQSYFINPGCQSCVWLFLCRGGCRRHREPFGNGLPQKNRFCAAYKAFFEHAYGRMAKMARML